MTRVFSTYRITPTAFESNYELRFCQKQVNDMRTLNKTIHVSENNVHGYDDVMFEFAIGQRWYVIYQDHTNGKWYFQENLEDDIRYISIGQWRTVFNHIKKELNATS